MPKKNPWTGKRVVVIGMGTSGAAAARLALRRGAEVVAVDKKELRELGEIARAFFGEGGLVESESMRDELVSKCELVIVSPGVPSFPALEAAIQRGVPVWGEVELAFRELAGKPRVLAVGGTNGKSTTTTLIGELLTAAGRRTFTGGNLGEPLANHVDEAWEDVVLEVSSFQMERVDAFAPHVAVLLNVSDDHLDRYPSFDAYAAAKGNMFLRQTADDVAVVPAGDSVCSREAKRGKGRLVTFGAGGDVDVTDDAVIDRARDVRFERAALGIKGAHNAANVAAAWAAVRDLGVSSEVARRVFAEFTGLAHRMALVAEIEGVRYYDDSKGTNVGASVTALRGLSEPKAVLIAGGVDKGGTYDPLVAALVERGRAAVLIGQAAPLIEAAIGDRVPVRRAASLADAVKVSAELARPGDAVLLSPACSSFDMFRDYKDRGDQFVRAVLLLKGEKEAK